MPSGRSQQIGILVDVVELFDLVFGFVLVRVEGAYVFDRHGVEMHTAERLPVVIVKEDAAIRLPIAHDYAGGVDDAAQDGLDDKVAFNLFLRRHDAGFVLHGFFCLSLFGLGGFVQYTGIRIRAGYALNAGQQDVIDVVVEREGDFGAEVIKDASPELPVIDLGDKVFHKGI